MSGIAYRQRCVQVEIGATCGALCASGLRSDCNLLLPLSLLHSNAPNASVLTETPSSWSSSPTVACAPCTAPTAPRTPPTGQTPLTLPLVRSSSSSQSWSWSPCWTRSRPPPTLRPASSQPWPRPSQPSPARSPRRRNSRPSRSWPTSCWPTTPTSPRWLRPTSGTPGNGGATMRTMRQSLRARPSRLRAWMRRWPRSPGRQLQGKRYRHPWRQRQHRECRSKVLGEWMGGEQDPGGWAVVGC